MSRCRPSQNIIILSRYLHYLVKATAGKKLAVRTEGDTVDGLPVAGKGMGAGPLLHVPEPHGRVEAG